VMVNDVELSTVDLVAHNGILHIMDLSVAPPTEDLVVGNRDVCTNLVTICSHLLLLDRAILSVCYRQTGLIV